MKIRVARSGAEGNPTERRTETFTGEVLGETLVPAEDGVTVNSVSFAPGARTDWHSHRAGQVLVVTAGGGTVAERSGDRVEIAVGDVVFIPRSVEHWHGARADCAMTHLAISIQETDWLDPVTEADYAGAAPGPAD